MEVSAVDFKHVQFILFFFLFLHGEALSAIEKNNPLQASFSCDALLKSVEGYLWL